MIARFWPLVIAAAAGVLLLFAGVSVIAVMLGSAALLEPMVIFAGLAVVLLLAMVAGIQVRFDSKLFFFSVETGGGGDSTKNSAANGG